jgi:flagellar hook assembly protein FlgD
VVTDYELVGNYPNPFNPSTTITFAMPEAGRVTLKIFSETGQLVRTLINGEKPPGQHNVSWNGRNDAGTAVASGMYFYQIVMQKQNGEAAFTETRRMTLVK